MNGSLTVKEREFVKAYVGQCAGNGSAAARKAGYSLHSAHVMSSRLLRRTRVHAAIRARLKRREERGLMADAELDAFLASVVRSETAGLRDRLKAADMILRTRGRYSSTVHLRGRLTLEEALGEVRARERTQQR